MSAQTCLDTCAYAVGVFAAAFCIFLFLIAIWYGDGNKVCRCPDPNKCAHPKGRAK